MDPKEKIEEEMVVPTQILDPYETNFPADDEHVEKEESLNV